MSFVLVADKDSAPYIGIKHEDGRLLWMNSREVKKVYEILGKVVNDGTKT